MHFTGDLAMWKNKKKTCQLIKAVGRSEDDCKGVWGNFLGQRKCSILTVVIIKICTLIKTHETGHLTVINVNPRILCLMKLIFKKGQLVVSFLF